MRSENYCFLVSIYLIFSKFGKFFEILRQKTNFLTKIPREIQLGTQLRDYFGLIFAFSIYQLVLSLFLTDIGKVLSGFEGTPWPGYMSTQVVL